MEKEKKLLSITVTHINIRQSITILLLKILTLDVIIAFFTIIFFSLASFSPNATFTERVLSFNVLVFVLMGILKISFTIYIILLWLNEYYEITPKAIIHKKGIIYRNTEKFELEYVRTLKVYQGLLGRILNFGTVELHDIRRNKRVEMYLIHNPHRYVRILEDLLEDPHEEIREFRRHIFEKDDLGEDGEQDEVEEG